MNIPHAWALRHLGTCRTLEILEALIEEVVQDTF